MTAAERQPLLELRDLAVAAGGNMLLRDLGVRLGVGERVGLIGPSGCGKTTLLRAVAHLEDPAAGEVRLEGRAPEEVGWPAFRRRVMLIQQRPVLLPGTVGENLRRPFAYHAAGGRQFPRDRATDLLERLRLGAGRMDQPGESLSEGQQQRVCLIRALLCEPEVLLLDEPTSALDADAVNLVEALLAEEIDRRSLACMVVTHDRAQVERWCDRSVDLASCMPEDART